MKLRVAACQMLSSPDIAVNAGKIAAWIGRAAKARVAVVSFPEYAICSYQKDPAWWREADPNAFQRAENSIVAEAKRRKVAVVLGTAHWEGKRIYNDLLLVDRDGRVKGRYSKIRPTDGETWITPGSKLAVAKLAGVRSGFFICYDGRYPELARLQASAGAEILYWCSKHSTITAEHKMSGYAGMPVSRATENGVYVVAATPPADPANLKSNSSGHGKSRVVDPDGNILAEGGIFEEALVMADIDSAKADRRHARAAVEKPGVMQGWLREGVRRFVKRVD